MATTNFVNGTVIEADWLNDVDEHVYETDYVADYSALRASTSSAAQIEVTTIGIAGSFLRDASDTTSGAWFTGSIATTVLTVSAVSNGTLAVGQAINRGDTGATVAYITALGTGSGGTGTYTLSASATVSSMVMSADDGGTMLVRTSDGLRVKRVFDGAVHVKWFLNSAQLADVVARTRLVDTYAAVQAAINATTRGAVEFLDGDYRCSDSPTVTKNNITLRAPATATIFIPATTTTSTGFALSVYSNTTTQPVNCYLENINVEISSNSGGNSGGIRWGGSYGGMKKVNSRIRGDNMKGVSYQTDDAGTGPYYNTFEGVFAQGDSNSTTVLAGTVGHSLDSSAVTPSRSPNANTWIRCRAGGVYDGHDIKGAGNYFDSCTSESINNYHYKCDHPSVSSGCIRTVVMNPYCEQYPTSLVMYCGTRSSGCLLINPYNTGVLAAIFTDASTLQNCRWLDPQYLPRAGAPITVAAAKVTGTTVNEGYNIASASTSGTGIFRVTFTTALPTTNYFVSCICATDELNVRISAYSTDYIQFVFTDLAGTPADPTGFNVIVMDTP